MRVISVKTLRDYWQRRVESRSSLEAWYDFVRHADWDSPADVKRDFSSASILEDKRVVFNIKGNQFRLVVRINYHHKAVFIRFVGTHAEYNRIDATRI
jgi:mRNA interferase HigB